jgi:uncharacterized protein YqjF (DUF2071 family)
MLNYPIERPVLEPLVPPGLELDAFASIAYVSVVRFLFSAPGCSELRPLSPQF